MAAAIKYCDQQLDLFDNVSSTAFPLFDDYFLQVKHSQTAFPFVVENIVNFLERPFLCTSCLGQPLSKVLMSLFQVEVCA